MSALQTMTPRQLETRVSELHSKRDELQQELDRFVESEMTPGQRERGERLTKGIENLEEELIEIRQERLRRVSDAADAGNVVSGEFRTGPTTYSRGNPFSPPSQPETAHEVRGRALAAVEKWNADDTLKQSATQTLERVGKDSADGGDADVAGVARHVLRYSHPDYVSAFRKYTADPETYVADLTPAEARVWREARQEQRATLGTSGAVLPSPLDPTVVLTNDGVIDPMRSVARVDTTVAKTKRYITSAGATFSFDAELAEVSDDTHTESEVTITNHKAQGWIEASLEAAMDQPRFESEVAKIIADGKARLEGDKFITGAGNGSDEPFGIETALAGTSSEVNAAAEALAADDVYGLLEALPPRFRQSARWQLELSTRNFIHRLWNPSGSEPPMIEGNNLVGLPYVLNSSIDPYSAVDAGATASNRVLFVGDWSNYVILDRVGLSVHYVPPGHLMSTTNGRPDGRVGWYAYWRVGADSLVDGAFRMCDVETTA